jgi:hypothetical protein
MKKLLKGVMGITSIAVMAAGAYYLTKKLLGEPDEELDDEYEDFDFDDEEEDAEDKSREYVTLDFEEDEQEASDEEESEDDEE